MRRPRVRSVASVLIHTSLTTKRLWSEMLSRKRSGNQAQIGVWGKSVRQTAATAKLTSSMFTGPTRAATAGTNGAVTRRARPPMVALRPLKKAL